MVFWSPKSGTAVPSSSKSVPSRTSKTGTHPLQAEPVNAGEEHAPHRSQGWGAVAWGGSGSPSALMWVFCSWGHPRVQTRGAAGLPCPICPHRAEGNGETMGCPHQSWSSLVSSTDSTQGSASPFLLPGPCTARTVSMYGVWVLSHPPFWAETPRRHPNNIPIWKGPAGIITSKHTSKHTRSCSTSKPPRLKAREEPQHSTAPG